MLVRKSNRLNYNRRIKSRSSDLELLTMLKIQFSNDSMKIYLSSGRIVIVPLSKFPEIKKLTSKQRSNYHIAGGISLDFDDSDEVYHIKELIGI